MRIEQSTYRIQPLSRVDKTRREKQDKSLAEIIVLEQIRAEIAARDEIVVPDETPEELAVRIDGNRELDKIGRPIGVLAALLVIVFIAGQIAMWLGR